MLLLVAAALALGAPAPWRAVVVGGNGRVGGSTVRWLLRLAAEHGRPLHVAVGGRSAARFDALRRALGAAGADGRISFAPCDLDDAPSLDAALAGVDVCVHTAGPFQSVERAHCLAAAVRNGVAYCDVCDNGALARAARDELDAPARAAGVPAVLACGIWPGVSALMLAAAVARLPADAPIDAELSFFTAGTGNAGPAIVAATFHLLAEPALCVRDGVLVGLRPWSERREVPFGARVGTRSICLLDNPDVLTAATAAPFARRLRTLSSRFGTAPQVWNELFGVVALAPARVLLDRRAMAVVARASEPVIRAVDRLVGATNAMRVDAAAGGRAVTLELVHPDLEDCVGLATAAFAWELLCGTVPPGVRYACELAGTGAGDAILTRARRGGEWREEAR
ncbi:hypothetical protein KFE25_011613 [Diacronema lutheri]|uniref:Saccharopine dehydrogenase NADP binding domain-containing protein n=1 Tax=Diacronema lutheri TaxID=2081491 RepID=A0A8J5XE44_DIALT|nr:hypothetical protein KFE25_011613 [Diacronema lutheri]